MNRDQPPRAIRLPEYLRLLVGLGGIIYQQVIGPVNLYLLVAFMLLTGTQGALWAVELFRRWPSVSPPARPESSTASGSDTAISPVGGDQ